MSYSKDDSQYWEGINFVTCLDNSGLTDSLTYGKIYKRDFDLPKKYAYFLIVIPDNLGNLRALNPNRFDPVKSDLENVCQYSGLPSVSSYEN
jgi:hypothetical protein